MPKCATKRKSGYRYRAYTNGYSAEPYENPEWQARPNWPECGGDLTIYKPPSHLSIRVYCSKCGEYGSTSNIKLLAKLWREYCVDIQFTELFDEPKIKKEIKRAINIEGLSEGEVRNKKSKP